MKQKETIFFISRLAGKLLVLGMLLVNITRSHAQEIIHAEATDSTFVMSADSVFAPSTLQDSIIYEAILPDSTIREAYIAADAVFTTDNTIVALPGKKTFKPNSTKAVLYAAAFPGLGQIYNRKYWKLPLIYGGYMGFMYAITWNNRMYQDYQNAYRDIMEDSIYRPDADPSEWSDNWKILIPRGDYENYITNTNFQNQLKRRKDYYRRYRDLSIILTIGFYAICMIDAYVDAELFDFDISPDLSMRIEPMILPRTSVNQWSFGLNYCITF